MKPGDTWPYSKKFNLAQIGSIAMKGSYTFKGMAPHGGAPCAELSEEGQLEMDLSGFGGDTEGGKAMQQLGMKIESGVIRGTTWFDPALGMAREVQFSQNMVIRMKNPTQPDASIEMPSKQVTTITLTGVDDVK